MKTLITNAHIISPGIDLPGGSVLVEGSKIIAVLQPGETDGVKWVSFAQVHEMIRSKQICKVIAKQFLKQESQLSARQKEKKH